MLRYSGAIFRSACFDADVKNAVLKLKTFWEEHPKMLRRGVVTFALIVTASSAGTAPAENNSPADAVAALIKAYLDFLSRIEEHNIVWKDGTRMPIDEGKGAKAYDAMLDDPDIKDMFSMKYPLSVKGLAPQKNLEPGRVRYLPLFKKMYGDCQTTGFMADAVDVVWLPTMDGKNVKFTKINGAAAALQKISNELAKLPGRFLDYLRQIQGTYNCRPIAGTDRQSPHGFGIAIDIAGAHSDYWLSSKLDVDGRIPYKNEIPWEIVDIFEKYGFIWGGKWYHYDTMHFEYRPEIIATGK